MYWIYLVTGRTESGDDWYIAFDESPTDEIIKTQILRDPWLKEEYEQECIQGWQVIEIPIIRN